MSKLFNNQNLITMETLKENWKKEEQEERSDEWNELKNEVDFMLDSGNVSLMEIEDITLSYGFDLDHIEDLLF